MCTYTPTFFLRFSVPFTNRCILWCVLPVPVLFSASVILCQLYLTMLYLCYSRPVLFPTSVILCRIPHCICFDISCYLHITRYGEITDYVITSFCCMLRYVGVCCMFNVVSCCSAPVRPEVSEQELQRTQSARYPERPPERKFQS